MPRRGAGLKGMGDKPPILVNPHRSNKREFTSVSSVVRSKTSLPPGIQAAKRGMITVKIEKVDWHTTSGREYHPPEISVGLSWWGETNPPTMLSYPSGPTEAEYVVNVSPGKIAKYLDGNRCVFRFQKRKCYRASLALVVVTSPVHILLTDATELKFGLSDPDSGNIYGYSRRRPYPDPQQRNPTLPEY